MTDHDADSLLGRLVFWHHDRPPLDPYELPWPFPWPCPPRPRSTPYSTNSDKPYVGDDAISKAQVQVNAVYIDAGQEVDNVKSCVHVARAQHRYYAEGRTWEQAMAISLRDLYKQLHPDGPGPTPPGPMPDMQRLTKGDQCLLAGDQRVIIRGVSAFKLLKQLSDGQTGEVDAWLDWCRAMRLNWVRVFTQCRNLFTLDPEAGRAALADLASRAGTRGLYVEAVAWVDTWSANALDCQDHVAKIGEIAAQYPNLFVEVANEPGQHWQAWSPDALRHAATMLPAGVPYTLGAADGANDERLDYCDTGTTCQNVHGDRGRQPWGNVRHTREQQVLSENIDQWVNNDEPMNANTLDEALAFGLGGLEAVCQIGGTHHSEFGKFCTLPDHDEQRIFDARRRGWDAVPATWWGQFANYRWTAPLPVNPVKEMVMIDNDSRCYASTNGSEAYISLTNVTEPPTFADGWRGEKVDGIGAASVWHAVRG